MKLSAALAIVLFCAGCVSDNTSTLVEEIKALDGDVVANDSGDIVYVNLSYCDINSHLLRRLTDCKQLNFLYLEHTSVTNEDLGLIGQITSLQVLNISGTKTTDEGLHFLTLIKDLRELKMAHYSLTRPLPEELKNAAVNEVVQGKVSLVDEQRYGEGLQDLITRFPALRTELWGELP